MAVEDLVPGGISPEFVSAMEHGLASMNSPSAVVIVTTEFVAAVRAVTGETSYGDDRGGGSVAARTVTTVSGEPAIVVNWNAAREFSFDVDDLARLLAHEAGHVSIDARREHPGPQVAGLGFVTDWDFQTAHSAAVALDEFRCETAVYKAGYPVEEGSMNGGIVNELYSLNCQILEDNLNYQQHLDVAQLRFDVLQTISLHVRYMACVAARHLHHDQIDPLTFGKYPAANWKTLLLRTWPQFVSLYSGVPDAFIEWDKSARSDALMKTVGLMHRLLKSFGFKAGVDGLGQETFHLVLQPQSWEVRRQRAVAETPLL